MKQVFLNILLNAIEAIEAHGKISITSREIHKNGTQHVQVEVADTGTGIPKKIVEQIFDPFFTTKDKGSGLGLSITHQIVEDHHGTIEVESMPKKGTTFFINIPC
jgi:signal transduction histidine kinase